MHKQYLVLVLVVVLGALIYAVTVAAGGDVSPRRIGKSLETAVEHAEPPNKFLAATSPKACDVPKPSTQPAPSFVLRTPFRDLQVPAGMDRYEFCVSTEKGPVELHMKGPWGERTAQLEPTAQDVGLRDEDAGKAPVCRVWFASPGGSRRILLPQGLKELDVRLPQGEPVTIFRVSLIHGEETLGYTFKSLAIVDTTWYPTRGQLLLLKDSGPYNLAKEALADAGVEARPASELMSQAGERLLKLSDEDMLVRVLEADSKTFSTSGDPVELVQCAYCFRLAPRPVQQVWRVRLSQEAVYLLEGITGGSRAYGWFCAFDPKGAFVWYGSVETPKPFDGPAFLARMVEMLKP